ncbi:hypothetical protein ACH5RR_038877 [Cinchona calisaya]|uniref:TIR domain-containing protein n=1 Tax=Cinchona calisaya TaxID=153742 RepID=A0ABD2XWK4_9GENT
MSERTSWISSIVLCNKREFTSSKMMKNSKEEDPLHLHYAKLLKSQELQLLYSQKTMLLLHGVWMSLRRSLSATTFGTNCSASFLFCGPSAVRKQKGTFVEHFARHEDEIENKGRIQRWRDALAEAAHFSGWDVPNTANGHDAPRKLLKMLLLIWEKLQLLKEKTMLVLILECRN